MRQKQRRIRLDLTERQAEMLYRCLMLTAAEADWTNEERQRRRGLLRKIANALTGKQSTQN